jgi:hypothetical protein
VCHLLFQQAQILDGEITDEPSALTERLDRLVQRRI